MKDFVLELASQKEGFNAKLNVIREYLQAYILRILYENKFFNKAVFLGGTALRFLHNLPRFSQDLDFSLGNKEDYLFSNIIKKIKQELILSNYDIALSYKDSGAVHSAMFKFKGLMYEAGLSPRKDENFSIKIEIDTKPPYGADVENSIINKYFILSLSAYTVSSLFAGKLHAIYSRKYAKGRDFFDLGWYLSKWKKITPNMVFLNNALKQTGYKGVFPSEDTWREQLYDIVVHLDWNLVKKDVENFLENPSDVDVFNKENILKLIKQ